MPSRLLISSLPLGALFIQHTRAALLATDRGALFQGDPHSAIAAGVVHDGAAALELATA